MCRGLHFDTLIQRPFLSFPANATAPATTRPQSSAAASAAGARPRTEFYPLRGTKANHGGGRQRGRQQDHI